MSCAVTHRQPTSMQRMTPRPRQSQTAQNQTFHVTPTAASGAQPWNHSLQSSLVVRLHSLLSYMFLIKELNVSLSSYCCFAVSPVLSQTRQHFTPCLLFHTAKVRPAFIKDVKHFANDNLPWVFLPVLSQSESLPSCWLVPIYQPILTMFGRKRQGTQHQFIFFVDTLLQNMGPWPFHAEIMTKSQEHKF